jgi:hypothetical protein
MKPITWTGIVLVVLGTLALAFQGINYTRHKDVVDLGSIHVTTETQERIPVPPVLGVRGPGIFDPLLGLVSGKIYF